MREQILRSLFPILEWTLGRPDSRGGSNPSSDYLLELENGRERVRGGESSRETEVPRKTFCGVSKSRKSEWVTERVYV